MSLTNNKDRKNTSHHQAFGEKAGSVLKYSFVSGTCASSNGSQFIDSKSATSGRHNTVGGNLTIVNL
jgi:hypothetical protein